MRSIIVSFYTPDYSEDAKRLISSLKKFNLEYDIDPIKSLGSWDLNTNYKTNFILDKLKKHKKPVVWVDADAVCRKYPHYLYQIDEDIGVHYRCLKNLQTGVVFFNHTKPAIEVLEVWNEVNKRDTERFDQRNLESILQGWYIESHRVSVFLLPDSYYHIFDLDKDKGEPTFEHYQASRRWRQKHSVR